MHCYLIYKTIMNRDKVIVIAIYVVMCYSRGMSDRGSSGFRSGVARALPLTPHISRESRLS